MKAWTATYYRSLAAGIIILYAIINGYCTTRLSITGDELAYFAYGINVLKGQPQKEVNANGIPIFNSQMPINAVHALPRAVQQLLQPSLKKDAAQVSGDIYWGRLFSVISALLLALYVLFWATQLYGKAAGIFSLILYCSCPNIMAHSQLVGTDVFSFLMVTATCYHAWRYGNSGHWRQLLWVALWLGLGQITKPSLLLLYPLVLAWLIIRLWPIALGRGQKILRLAKELAIIGAISLLIINVGFLFQHSGKPLKEYAFVSAQYQGLQQRLGWAGSIPLPLPQPYLQGLDYISFNVETGPGIEGKSSYGSNYFLGRKTDGQRLWYYYPLCWLYKMPLGFLCLFVLALLLHFTKRKIQSIQQGAVYLLLPALFMMLMFCFFNHMYLGIRSTLLVAPLLFVLVGSLIPYIDTKVKGLVLCLLLGWQLISVGRWFPHFLPYTNELVWDKKAAHTIFTDSNIYFQEAGILVGEYLQRHPDVQWEPAAPVKGRVLVSVEAYYDWWNLGRMQWLRDLRLQPVDHFDSGYLVFEVK
jgi:hypothetical protein